MKKRWGFHPQDVAVPRLADDLRTLYAQGTGGRRFRLRFADFLRDQAGHAVDGESLFMTNGSSQGLQMVLDLFTSEGDTIFVENPTYFLALAIFKGRGLNVVGVETDEQGINVEDLEAKLRVHGRLNKKPPVVYVIPTFSNPTGVTLSMERRHRLLDLSRRTEAKIVADEVYQFLAFGDQHRGSVDHNVITLNSFSKIMAPGLRLGWLQASEPLLKHIEEYGPIQSGGGLNPVVLQLVHHALEATDKRGQGVLAQHLASLPTASLTSLSSHGADGAAAGEARRRGVCFDRPSGGYFVWLRLPDLLLEASDDASLRPHEAFARACRDRGVAYQPGHRFTAASPPSSAWENYARLSFAYYSPDEIAEGVRRLASVIDDLATRQ
ncbi:GntR family transcriptional regulator, putative [Acanthamoeba castellanii str. Neff]|uniref:GntR family transcriptional regulator, putative n=1 Tax=Acanthamoeba castellanii (strain ATCC 30010 / Neff) TaxID=1257118 RepID=L8GIY6_ACACF|nr:GntR family transcriptional regulator, putative [Acanthamoeba castellanii str. Neff]ELR12972.1 GntR family transcriptional regulator, putative [Acanthamoeba castellanii str. Neff]